MPHMPTASRSVIRSHIQRRFENIHGLRERFCVVVSSLNQLAHSVGKILQASRRDVHIPLMITNPACPAHPQLGPLHPAIDKPPSATPQWPSIGLIGGGLNAAGNLVHNILTRETMQTLLAAAQETQLLVPTLAKAHAASSCGCPELCTNLQPTKCARFPPGQRRSDSFLFLSSQGRASHPGPIYRCVVCTSSTSLLVVASAAACQLHCKQLMKPDAAGHVTCMLRT